MIGLLHVLISVVFFAIMLSMVNFLNKIHINQLSALESIGSMPYRR